MIFRSYAPTKCFLGKGKVSVLLEGYRFPPAITNYICLRWFFRTNEHIAKAIKVLVTY